MRKVLTIDPGRTTGVCLGIYQGGRNYEIERCWEVVWEQRFAFVQSIAEIKPDVLVVEAFRLYAHKSQQQIGSDFPSVQLIGAIEYVAYHANIPLIYQMPSNISQTAILDRHLPLVQGSEHKKDAYKHLRYFCITKGPKL